MANEQTYIIEINEFKNETFAMGQRSLTKN